MVRQRPELTVRACVRSAYRTEVGTPCAHCICVSIQLFLLLASPSVAVSVSCKVLVMLRLIMCCGQSCSHSVAPKIFARDLYLLTEMEGFASSDLTSVNEEPGLGTAGASIICKREQVHPRASGHAPFSHNRFDLSVEKHTTKEELLPCFQACVNRWQVYIQ
jgi:hypothetical protein